MDPIELDFNKIGIPPEKREELSEFAAKIEDQSHLNVLIDVFVSEAELAEFGNPEDPYALFDLISARIDETKGLLEEYGIMLDRLRMPNKPPWDYEDFLIDDPTFLERYFESRRAEQPTIKVSVIQNPYLFTIFFKDPKRGFISGLGGVVLRSDDSGRGWRYETLDRKQALFSVSSADGRTIAVGEKGLVRVSTDGGLSWSMPSGDEFPTETRIGLHISNGAGSQCEDKHPPNGDNVIYSTISTKVIDFKITGDALTGISCHFQKP